MSGNQKTPLPAEIEQVRRAREKAEATLAAALDNWTALNERYLALQAAAARGGAP